jgi:hypothetical protein
MSLFVVAGVAETPRREPGRIAMRDVGRWLLGRFVVAKSEDRQIGLFLTKAELRVAIDLVVEGLAIRRRAAVARAGSEQISSEDAAELTELGQVLGKLLATMPTS